ncbi:MAG: MFS transporter, partial [Sciscionella sp.]
YMVFFGAGLGLCMQTLSLAAQNAVPARDMGVATSTSTSFRQLGGTLGVAIFFSLLFSTVSGNIKDAITDALHTTAFQSAIHDPAVLGNPVNKPVVDLLRNGGAGSGSSGVLQNASFLQHIDHRLAHPFFVGFAQSMSVVFLCAAGIAFVAFLLFLVMREVPLRQYSGLQEAAMAEAAAAATAAEPVAEAPTGGQHSLTSHNGHRVGDLSTQLTAGGWLRGQVRRPDGSAVTNATLTLIDPSGRQVGRATTATDGAYHIDTPNAGTYVLLTSAESHQPQAASVVLGDHPVDTDVVLTGTASLIGTVTEAGSSTPVPGATTTLADDRGEVVGSQTTDTDGGYRFPDLVAGSYTLVVSAPSHRPSARTVPVPATGQAREDVDLASSVTLYGVARAQHTGHPVADARITLLDTARNIVGVTDTDNTGRYRFDDLPEGDYTLIASGYPPAAGTLRMHDGSHAQHDIELGHPHR